MNEAERKKLMEAMRKAAEESLATRMARANVSLTHPSVAAKFNLQNYLDKYVEGYLFADLESMIKYIPSDLHPGAAAYPMILTVCAGMEFLGALLRPSLNDGFKDNDGLRYFGHYWKNYLCKQQPAYKPYSELARTLLRNGLAHLFMAKPRVGVVKSNPALHLKTINDSLVFDATVLFKDFKSSYFEFAKPVIMDGKSGTQLADRRIHQILARYSSDTDLIFGTLKSDDLPRYEGPSTTTTTTLSGTLDME